VKADVNTDKHVTCSVSEGLERLLREKRQALEDESGRFLTSGDAEALHDLRVAMRRLHSLFVAFTPAFRKSLPFVESLRLLQKQTNHARDLEVTLAIMQDSRLQLPWLEIEWQRELEEEYARLRQLLPGAWQQLAPELDNISAFFNEGGREQKLGPFTAELLKVKAHQLKRQRKKLCRKWGDKPAHKLRITGKQVRYLLEPLGEEIGTASAAVTKLKAFQDLLGDYHDIVVLRKKLKKQQRTVSDEQRNELKAARKQLKNEAKKLRKHFIHKHCDGKGKKLDKLLRKTGSQLAQS